MKWENLKHTCSPQTVYSTSYSSNEFHGYFLAPRFPKLSFLHCFISARSYLRGLRFKPCVTPSLQSSHCFQVRPSWLHHGDFNLTNKFKWLISQCGTPNVEKLLSFLINFSYMIINWEYSNLKRKLAVLGELECHLFFTWTQPHPHPAPTYRKKNS